MIEASSIEVVRLPLVTYVKNEQGVLIPGQHMERRAIVTLRTLRVWKGEQTEEYQILAGAPPESPLTPGLIVVDCQQHLEVGKRYLIFATDGYPEADPCAPTGELDKSDSVITALDRYLALRKRGGALAIPH